MKKIFLLIMSIFLAWGYTQAQLPEISTADTPVWYFIQVKGNGAERENRVFTAETDANEKERVNGRPLTSTPDNLAPQLWRFEQVDADNSYVIINKSTGKKINLEKEVPSGGQGEALTVATQSETPATTWLLPENSTREGYYNIQAATWDDGNKYIHQGSNYNERDYPLQGYTVVDDDNSIFRFLKMEDVFVSDPIVSFTGVTVEGSAEKNISILLNEGVTGPITVTGTVEGYTINTDGIGASGGILIVTFTPTEAYKVYAGDLTVTVGTTVSTISLSGQATPVASRPTISNDENGDVWYYVNWHRAGAGKSLTDSGLDEFVINRTINEENNKNQLWKLNETETAERYNLQGLTGHFINADGNNKIKPSETAVTAYQLVDNTSWGAELPVAFSLFTGTGTTALDHVNSGDQIHGISTWGGESGVSQGAAVSFIIAPPNVYTDETEVDFGLVSLKVGQSDPQTIQIIPVNIPSYTTSTATITGDDAAAFEITTEGDITNEIAMIFKPTEEKDYAATLTVTTGTYSTTVALTGEGLGSPRINTDKDVLAFGNVTLNKKKVMTISVSGINLEEDINYSLTGDNAADFVIDDSEWLAAEGGKLTFTLTPTALQDFNATLTLTTTGAESPKVIELTATGVELNIPFEFSSADGEDKWYYIFSERGNAYLEDKGAGKAIETSVATGADSQLWKFVETDYSDQYLFISKTGNYLAYNATAIEDGAEADRFITAADGTFTYGVFSHTNEGFWQILCNEIGTTGSYINKLNSNLVFGAYSVVNDAGAAVKFIPQAEVSSVFPKISEGDNEYWYYIQFNSNAELIVEDKGMEETMKAETKNHVSGANQLWKITGTAGNYKLISKANPTAHVLMKDDAFISSDASQIGFIVTNTVEEGTSFSINTTPKGYLAIIPEGNTTGFNPFGGAQVGNYIGLYGVTDNNTQIVFKEWADASLSGITVDQGTLSPVFASDTYKYTVTVPSSATAITITATATDSNATIEGDGTIDDLEVGENTVEITVTSATGGNSIKYTITVIRESNDATLASLTVSEGTLDPAFDPAITDYTVHVSADTRFVQISARANVAAAVIEGTGLKNNLQEGSNEFTVTVTAQDKVTKKEYKVNIIRATVGVDNPEAKEVIISSENGILTASFDGTKDIQLFSITGLLLDTATATNTYTKALTTGTYVLVIDGVTYKAIVK